MNTVLDFLREHPLIGVLLALAIGAYIGATLMALAAARKTTDQDASAKWSATAEAYVEWSPRFPDGSAVRAAKFDELGARRWVAADPQLRLFCRRVGPWTEVKP